MRTINNYEMRLVLVFLIIFFASSIQAQNLVVNSNFEEYTSCPTMTSDFTTLNWVNPFWPGTPNYFNICDSGEVSIPINEFGSQESSTGSAYVGIYTYGSREFIQGELLSPTTAGSTYELTIIYSSADNFGHSDGLGMLLSTGPPVSYMGEIPQMQKTNIVESQTEWHTITQEYISPGGETHVTIGNFYNDSNSNFIPEGMYMNSAYYYIDSIAVKCIGTLSSDFTIDLGENIALCENDYPFTIINNLPNAYNEWSTGETGDSIDVDGPGTYFVKSFIDCEYAIDTIVISTIEEPEIFIDETICVEEDHIILLDSENGDYEWNDGSIGSELVVNASGLYYVTLTHECGIREDSISVIIDRGLRNLDLMDTYVLCEEESLPVDLSGLLVDSILWNDGSIDEERILDESGIYAVKITNVCIDTTIIFEFKQELCTSETIYIPNIFSPNNDGINDYFSIGFSKIWPSFDIKFFIYDRWGELIFYSEDPNFRWDGNFNGKSLNPNVFVYYYELEVVINGELQLITASGDITLVK